MLNIVLYGFNLGLQEKCWCFTWIYSADDVPSFFQVQLYN